MTGVGADRQGALLTLARMREPLGPFREPEDAEALEREWAGGAGEGAIDAMLDLLVHPPGAAELDGADPDRLEYEISRALTLLGEHHPEALRDRARQAMAWARPTLIEVLGALGDEEGLDLLAPLVRDPGLSEEEATRLACALGEIGGAAAAALLAELRSHRLASNPRVAEEIETAALQAGAARGRRLSPN